MRYALLCWSVFVVWLTPCQAAVVSKPEFPFKFHEGLLWVKVKVPESPKSLNFLLDSGAQVSAVNLQTAKELGLVLGQRVEVVGVGVAMEAFWTATRSVKAGGVELPNRLLALDLQKLSQSCECRVDGLIGADFFKNRRVQLDFRKSNVRLLSLTVACRGDATILNVRRCGMRVKATIDGKKTGWLRVDTGCATPLQWVTTDVSTKNCTRRIAVGLTRVEIPQTSTEVKIGNTVLLNVTTGLHASPIFDGEAGLIGNGLLSQFESVTFDANGSKLILGRRLSSALGPKNR